MAGETVGAQGLVANPVHPLEGLGLGTNNNEQAALMEMMGSMPGAAELQQANQPQQHVAPAPELIQQQMPNAPGQPILPQPVAQVSSPAQEFNAAFDQQMNPQQPQPAQPVPMQPQSGQPQLQPGQVVMGQDDYDFLLGLMKDQGAAIASIQGGNPAQPGPSGTPVNPMMTPGAPPAPPVTPEVAPLSVPDVKETTISEDEFNSLTTDRGAFQKFLAKRDANVAATVTEQVSKSVLPTVYAHMAQANEQERAVSTFLTANPDLAAQPGALQAALEQAKAELPYAQPERLLYHAANKLRAAQGVNNGINQSVQDFRGQRPRRAPVVGDNRPLRMGQQADLSNVNPFTVMRKEMIEHAQPGSGDILRTLGISK